MKNGTLWVVSYRVSDKRGKKRTAWRAKIALPSASLAICFATILKILGERHPGRKIDVYDAHSEYGILLPGK